MSQSLKNEDRLVQYLLGLMPEKEMIELEEVYLLNDDLNDDLQAAERDLIDKYLEGILSDKEQNRFENFFLSSPGRVERLRFARALKAYGSKLETSEKNDTLVSTPGHGLFSVPSHAPMQASPQWSCWRLRWGLSPGDSFSFARLSSKHGLLSQRLITPGGSLKVVYQVSIMRRWRKAEAMTNRILIR